LPQVSHRKGSICSIFLIRPILDNIIRSITGAIVYDDNLDGTVRLLKN